MSKVIPTTLSGLAAFSAAAAVFPGGTPAHDKRRSEADIRTHLVNASNTVLADARVDAALDRILDTLISALKEQGFVRTDSNILRETGNHPQFPSRTAKLEIEDTMRDHRMWIRVSLVTSVESAWYGGGGINCFIQDIRPDGFPDALSNVRYVDCDTLSNMATRDDLEEAAVSNYLSCLDGLTQALLESRAKFLATFLVTNLAH